MYIYIYIILFPHISYFTRNYFSNIHAIERLRHFTPEEISRLRDIEADADAHKGMKQVQQHSGKPIPQLGVNSVESNRPHRRATHSDEDESSTERDESSIEECSGQEDDETDTDLNFDD